jgi:hypothetical protein
LKFPGPLPTFPTLGFDPGRRKDLFAPSSGAPRGTDGLGAVRQRYQSHVANLDYFYYLPRA